MTGVINSRKESMKYRKKSMIASVSMTTVATAVNTTINTKFIRMLMTPVPIFPIVNPAICAALAPEFNFAVLKNPEILNAVASEFDMPDPFNPACCTKKSVTIPERSTSTPGMTRLKFTSNATMINFGNVFFMPYESKFNMVANAMMISPTTSARSATLTNTVHPLKTNMFCVGSNMPLFNFIANSIKKPDTIKNPCAKNANIPSTT